MSLLFPSSLWFLGIDETSINCIPLSKGVHGLYVGSCSGSLEAPNDVPLVLFGLWATYWHLLTTSEEQVILPAPWVLASALPEPLKKNV